VALHIDIPTQAQIAALLDARAEACVSIYLPTSPLPQDAEAARIEFKNLGGEALRQLDGNADIAEHLEDLGDDSSFWEYLANSLAVFVTADSLRTFRLPNHLVSLVEVSDRFHLKPLLRSVTFPQAALVLALAQGSVRVIEVAGDVPATELAVADLPADLAATLPERTVSGRFEGAERQKVRMRQYARAVDRALRPMLSDLPLILAAAEPLASIYRSVNGYPNLLADGIPGNPETLSAAELADAARPLLDSLYATELVEVRRRFERRVTQGRGVTDLTDVARAATFGAIDTLMTDIDEVVPGFVDADSGAVTLDGADDAANYGVFDEIARRVLESGGRVLALRRDDIPSEGAVAAILRYPV
jgi:Bacterial archaeo-eukaryotic release factor family 11